MSANLQSASPSLFELVIVLALNSVVVIKSKHNFDGSSFVFFRVANICNLCVDRSFS